MDRKLTECHTYPDVFESSLSGNVYQEYRHSMSESDSDENLSSYEAEPVPIVFLKSVTSIIDRLYRLAFKIRNPRIRIGLKKTSEDGHKLSETKNHLITCLKNLDTARIHDLLRSYHPTHDIEKKEYLIQRLVKANAHRRERFEYWRHRREQYEAESNFELTGIAASISEPATASFLDTDNVDLSDGLSTASTSTSLVSALEGSDNYLTIPRPPTIGPDAKEFECPYCYTLLDAKTLREDKWE